MKNALKDIHTLWLKNYRENLELSNKSYETIKNYDADLRKFLTWYESNYSKKTIKNANTEAISLYKKFLGNGGPVYSYFSIKQRVWAGFLNFFKKDKLCSQLIYTQSPLAISSQRRHLSSVKNFFEFLKQTYEEKEKKFRINPFKSKLHAIKLKEVDVKNTKMLEHHDWDKLIEETYHSRDRLILYLLYYGGMRISEVLNLDDDCFDTKRQIIIFQRKGGYRHELIPQNASTIFYEYKKYRNLSKSPSKFLFINSKDKKLTSRSLYNIIMKLLKKSFISTSITPHSFRKACATNLYIKTKDLLLVRDYLNHNDAKVTQTYIDKKTLNKDYYQYL